MRIAWVTPYLPSPEDTGGRIRIANLARGFASSDELHLYARRSVHDGAFAAGHDVRFDPWSTVQTRAFRAGKLPSLLPGAVQDFPAELWSLVAQDHSRAGFDAIIFEHCHAGRGLVRLPGATLLLDEHNIESRYFSRQYRVGNSRVKNFSKWLKWRTWERRMWRLADQVFAVTDEDVREIRRVRPDVGVVVPNGVHFGAYRFVAPSQRSSNAVLFVGMLSYPPNVEAATTLAQRILPALRQRIPDACLTLAGRDPSPEVRALVGQFVRVTGTLPSVVELFDHHGAYAMPLTFGAGSSLKVLEPLAAGLPLVASSFAVRGFGLQPGRHYLPAESTAECIAALERALTRRHELDSMADAGRALASKYSWAHTARTFVASVRAEVSQRPRS